MNINTMTFVALNLACGARREHPSQWGCDRRATKPQAKFGATRRAAGLFRPDFVARSLQIHGGICSSLAPRLGEKSLAANVIAFMFMTTRRQGSSRKAHSLMQLKSIASRLMEAAKTLRAAVERLEFGPPVTHVYNPLAYGWRAHTDYLGRYANSRKRVLFLGMNPGPFGMAQTGVPFGEVNAVKDWLRIKTPVGRPAREHPRRRVLGFACPRSEVSGRRLWNLFAETRARAVLSAGPVLRTVTKILRTVTKTGSIPHPSPANPAANRNWSGAATARLNELGVWRDDR